MDHTIWLLVPWLVFSVGSCAAAPGGWSDSERSWSGLGKGPQPVAAPDQLKGTKPIQDTHQRTRPSAMKSAIDRLLRRPEVIHRVGLSRTTIYSLIATGEFPSRS